MKLTKYYDNQKKCWAIRYGDKIEYFNHGCDSPIHNERNAKACFELLQKVEEMQKQLLGENNG